MAKHLKAGEVVVIWLMKIPQCCGGVGDHPRGFEERWHCARLQGWSEGSHENRQRAHTHIYGVQSSGVPDAGEAV